MPTYSTDAFAGTHALPPPPPQPETKERPVTRGRAYSAATRSFSPRMQVSQPSPTDLPERKSSTSYNHHRQTSIVHGVQHSRSPSQIGFPNTNPPSPRVLQAASKKDNVHTGQDGFIEGGRLRKSPSASVLSPSFSPVTAQDQYQSIISPQISPNTFQQSPNNFGSKVLVNGRIVTSPAPPEITTVGEYALHHLLTNFIEEADIRINRCMNDASEASLNIESICGPGADYSFDQLIKALGHIGRDRPKSLIDSVMLWRRRKGDVTQALHKEHDRLRSQMPSPNMNNPLRRMQNGSQSSFNMSLPVSNDNSAKLNELAYEIRRAERRSAISVYILCRALMQIIAQYRPGTLPEETAERLEEVIWAQVRATDAQSLSQSLIKQAQWNMFGQLLGVMSGPRFQNISHRYINELGAMQVRLSVKGHMETEIERKAVLLVSNMAWLKVRLVPDSAWEMSCDLVKLTSSYFSRVHGRDIKYAYCQLIENLLLPIAAKATAQLNSQKWRSVIDVLRPKINQMLLKPKHWAQAFPLLTATLCTSPVEIFSQQWIAVTTNLQPKLRDRSSRSAALKALCRLAWRYLYRIHDPSPSKKIEEIIKMILLPGKRAILSTEPAIADPLIQLIRIIGFRCQDLVFRSILFPLMNAETILSGRPHRIDALDPDRMVIGIRAYLAIMADLEQDEQPKFPQSFECDALLDPYNRSPHSHRRSTSHSSISSVPHQMEHLSKPVSTAKLSDITKGYHYTFCKILGEICIVCDDAFGGQAVLDEKLSQTTPKTPMSEAFAFGRRDRDEILSPTDMRQSFYDLLHVAVQALPRCILPSTPFHPLVNLLCTGTAHMQSHIASSSAQSLKSIARESNYSQQVASGFSRFIFNFDDRYATVASGGLLGAHHIESTLRLYVELLEIWIEQLQQAARKPSFDANDTTSISRTPTNDLNRSRQFAHVDEVESHGLFFLCSPSRHVRAFAIRVLRLVSKFDVALGRPSTRIISILEGSSQQVIDVNDEKLTTAERSRLQKGLRKSSIGSTLVELCSSDIPHDSTLWVKVFPGLIRLSQVTCPQAVLLTRDIVCSRLLHSQTAISKLADPQQDMSFAARYAPKHALSPSEVTIEQWKLHLIFACTTLTNIGSHPSVSSTNGVHTRKTSKSSSNGEDKITSATELFNKVVNFLGSSNEHVRIAAAVGLGTVNANLYRALLEALQPAVHSCAEDARQRMSNGQRHVSSPRRGKRIDYLRTEITHLYRLTAVLLTDEGIIDDEWILMNLIGFTKDLRIFLNDHDVQHQLVYQKLRTHFCGLIEVLYEAVAKTKEPLRWMPFQIRKAVFSMMEEWCGYSPNQARITEREDNLSRSLVEHATDPTNRGGMSAALEIEKKDLRAAALSSMASLCAGPVSTPLGDQTALQFDIKRMLQWIDTIFNDTPSDKTHATGKRALRNLIQYNPDHSFLLARSLEMCYMAKAPKTLASYFDVVTQVLSSDDLSYMPFWRVLCAGLYTLGNTKSDIRMKSTHLLRTLEERQGKSSKLQDLDISVSDRTTAVYKLAQFQISQRLSKEHENLAFHVFSEFSFYFKDLEPDHQRNMVSAMLPWLQTIELQIDTEGRPTSNSHMLLVNLIEITVRSSSVLHNEIQALWQALATGPHGGNVQVVLDFIILICLDRREQNFVDYAKQVVVFLSGTPAGSKVIEFLLLQLTPRSMVNERAEFMQLPTNSTGLPYVAELNQILPIGAKQAGLSLGQLALMLLVDLVVSPVQLPTNKVPLLLQTVITQWDHYTALVQDQAREMLVHLIHELVISKIEPGMTVPDKTSIEELIEMMRQMDPRVTWLYSDNGESSSSQISGVPEPMAFVIEEVVRVFSIAIKLQAPDFDIRAQWARTTLDWATSCPVRHVACRSFQIYRCILQHPDQQMLADMLVRLTNTIAADDEDFLMFSREILMTLRVIIRRLEPVDMLQYPQLFWITAACLDTIYETEFDESLTMLEQLLDRLDLSDPALVKLFYEKKPADWEGEFDGLQTLVYKGLRSALCLERSLKMLDRMVQLPSSELVGNDHRLLFTLLGNLPKFLVYFDDKEADESRSATVEILVTAAESQGHGELAKVLASFAAEEYGSENDFLIAVVGAIRLAFFPSQEFDSLVFLIGLLNNQLPWYKIKTMKLLCIILPDIDMRKPDFASCGPDLISPLLRLLQTNYCQQALDVLDNVMSMTGTPLDQKHIRMSMAGSHSSRGTRKQYDSTKSLYGIPEESGWSVPMPAIHAARTRSNVQAVVRTCLKPGMADAAALVETPIIEFEDEQSFGQYFPNDAKLVADHNNRPVEGAMSDLVMKLDSLDDFFDDHDDDQPQDVTTIPRYSSIINEDREILYDKHTLPILHKTLDRTSSVTSFHASFADQRYVPPRDPLVMTPAAFASPKSINSDLDDPLAMPKSRPPFHSRSITSPAATIPKSTSPHHTDYALSEDDADNEHQPSSFSDDESGLSRSATLDDTVTPHITSLLSPALSVRSAAESASSARAALAAHQHAGFTKRSTSLAGSRPAPRRLASAMPDLAPELDTLAPSVGAAAVFAAVHASAPAMDADATSSPVTPAGQGYRDNAFSPVSTFSLFGHHNGLAPRGAPAGTSVAALQHAQPGSSKGHDPSDSSAGEGRAPIGIGITVPPTPSGQVHGNGVSGGSGNGGSL